MKLKLEDIQLLQLFVKEGNKEKIAYAIHPFLIVEGVSLWDVNRKLKRLSKKGFSQNELDSGKIIVPLSMKKSNLTVTPQEKIRIEKKINQLEGLELLKLNYFNKYKAIYMEKKMFGEVSRWIEIHVV